MVQKGVVGTAERPVVKLDAPRPVELNHVLRPLESSRVRLDRAECRGTPAERSELNLSTFELLKENDIRLKRIFIDLKNATREGAVDPLIDRAVEQRNFSQ